MRYSVEVVYPDGNPIEIAQFTTPENSVLFTELKRTLVKPADKLRVVYRVVDTDDPETDVEAMLDE